MKEYIEGVGEVQAPNGFKEKAANFWYHYKWHSIISLILVFTVIICSFQFCQKQDYDMHIMYAGPYVVGKTASEGDEAEVVKVISSLKRVAKDFDKDGSININFTNFLYMSEDEMNSIGQGIDYSFISNDKKSLEGALEYSEYYLCFISQSVYEAYNEMGDIDMFMPLNEFSDYVRMDGYYSDNAIRLSSTDFYKMPGISSLPEDTLICIKTPSILASKSKEHQEYISRAEDSLRNILAFTINPIK